MIFGVLFLLPLSPLRCNALSHLDFLRLASQYDVTTLDLQATAFLVTTTFISPLVAKSLVECYFFLSIVTKRAESQHSPLLTPSRI
jgi:hypothetical protein